MVVIYLIYLSDYVMYIMPLMTAAYLPLIKLCSFLKFLHISSCHFLLLLY